MRRQQTNVNYLLNTRFIFTYPHSITEMFVDNVMKGVSRDSVHRRVSLVVLVNGIHDRRASMLIKRTSRYLYRLCDPTNARAHTHLDTRALCRLMLGVSCQGLFIFFGAR